VAADTRVRVGGRVLRLVAPRRTELIGLPVPEPGDGDVVVRVRSVGVGGTDLHAFSGRSARLPVVLGHDVVGTVTAVGGGGPGGRTGLLAWSWASARWVSRVPRGARCTEIRARCAGGCRRVARRPPRWGWSRSRRDRCRAHRSGRDWSSRRPRPNRGSRWPPS